MHDGRRRHEARAPLRQATVRAERVHARWLERSRAFNQFNVSPPDRNIKCGLLFQQHIERAIQRNQSDASLPLNIIGLRVGGGEREASGRAAYRKQDGKEEEEEWEHCAHQRSHIIRLNAR